MPSDAVVVRAPETAPSRIASWKRNTYLPMYMLRISGTVVATMPQTNRPMPCVLRPLTKPGPAEIPTTAMKMLRPTEFMNQTVEDGIRPKNGRAEHDGGADERDVGNVGRPVENTQILGGGRGVLGPAHERQNVASLDRRVW